jgi:Mg-chelatase subunit ChlI
MMFDGAKPGTDIENLLQWAYAQTVYLDYRNASPRALAYNHGYTAIPKGFHSTFEGGDVAVTMLSSTAADARRIVAAVELLDPWTQAIVARCAKSQVRPDCFLGVEAREVKTTLSWRKRKKGGGKKRSDVYRKYGDDALGAVSPGRRFARRARFTCAGIPPWGVFLSLSQVS